MSRYRKMPLAMLSIGVACASILVAEVEAGELPSRKPGLWEVKTRIGDNARALTVQQCIDAATDQLLQSSAGPFSASLCERREAKRSEGSMTIDSRCTIGGKAGTAHAAVTGSFESAYTMTVTSEGGDLPPAKMTIEGKWLGACAADQQPGDVVMAGGVKVNILELQKRALAPADFPPPAK
jgi:uncharacterized protein DUF3617